MILQKVKIDDFCENIRKIPVSIVFQ